VGGGTPGPPAAGKVVPDAHERARPQGMPCCAVAPKLGLSRPCRTGGRPPTSRLPRTSMDTGLATPERLLKPLPTLPYGAACGLVKGSGV
jgi:hypothetical protein